MKYIIAFAIAMLVSSSAMAENWIDYKNKTYVGGYYAAVCNICIQGRYQNDTNNMWQCTDDRDATTYPTYPKGCAKAIFNAMFNKETDPISKPDPIVKPEPVKPGPGIGLPEPKPGPGIEYLNGSKYQPRW